VENTNKVRRGGGGGKYLPPDIVSDKKNTRGRRNYRDIVKDHSRKACAVSIIVD